MSGVATAVVGGAVIGGIASNMAAGKQAKGQEQAAQIQEDMFNKIVGLEQPYIKAGYGASETLQNLLGYGPAGKGHHDPATGLPVGYLTQTFNPTQAQLNQYPGYQFALKTGGQAIRNADTPGVGALSGAALKDLMGFNVGTANQFYGQYFNQFQQQQNNIFDRLSNIASMGQNAASQTGSQGSQLGQGIAQATAGAAASRAGGIVGAGNALGSGLSTAALMKYYQPSNAGVSAVGGAPVGGFVDNNVWNPDYIEVSRPGG